MADADYGARSYRPRDGLRSWVQEVRRASNRLLFLSLARPGRAWDAVGATCGSWDEKSWTGALQERPSDITRIRWAWFQLLSRFPEAHRTVLAE